MARARPRFRGHEQPRLPGELGFYDLRLPETREAQATLARGHGVEAFCYWHYWFAGRRLLERPFEEVLASGHPDFPFCLGWANHSWTRVWEGKDQQRLIEQTYPGDDDHRRHFATIEPALHDRRYVRVDGVPVFFLFRPQDLPDLTHFIELWKQLAVDSGLGGMHIVGRVEGYWHRDEGRRLAADLDAVSDYSLGYAFGRLRGDKLHRRLRRRPRPARYALAAAGIPRLFDEFRSYPRILPGWDSTPRHGARGSVLRDRDPHLFEDMVRRAIALVADRPFDDRLVILKSWNEWAEGNYIEPDRTWGRSFLEALDRATRAEPTAPTGPGAITP